MDVVVKRRIVRLAGPGGATVAQWTPVPKVVGSNPIRVSFTSSNNEL